MSLWNLHDYMVEIIDYLPKEKDYTISRTQSVYQYCFYQNIPVIEPSKLPGETPVHPIVRTDYEHNKEIGNKLSFTGSPCIKLIKN